MSIFTKEDLDMLTSPREGLCISIYMPTERKGQETRQNAIRFKNLLDQAESMLYDSGLRKEQVDDLLNPGRSILSDHTFWQHQGDGLAAFFTEDLFQTYQLPQRVEEDVVVTNRFQLKPLIPFLNAADDAFYILALSQNNVRFFRASANDVNPVDLPDLPKSMDEALPENASFDKTHHRIGGSESTGLQGSDRPGTYHGLGQTEVDKGDEITRFFRKVDDAVTRYLKDSKAPLVLAGVEYHLPLYQAANTYKHLLDTIIPGSPDQRRADELQEAGWKLVKPLFENTRQDNVAEYKRLSGQQDQRALKDLEEIVKAAATGRVDVLFVQKNVQKWGKFDPDKYEVKFTDQESPEMEDLLDYAAIQTLQNGGIVYALDPQEVPEPETPAAAILRY